ncbi:MAG: protein kinase [Verrucomicrobiota bacterium]|jgi:WD40 repeat protein/serine/threonine protein kinase
MDANSDGSLDREREIFLAALERASPGERAAFLDAACGNDAPLRARLESLLRRHAKDRFLEDPAADLQTMPLSEPLVGESIGAVIGRYKLREKIGEGGCGVVYVAEQTEPVRRRVALKVIKLGMDTKQVIARFGAERQALAMMDHPNIAKVLDAGSTEAGRPYFVMELVRGIRITDYCDQNQLPTRERLDLFIQVCRAVQHAHQKGIIHRDLKPSNILVTLHDGVPVPKVIDFGIAKATEGRLADLTVYTELHQFIGTPAYVSPEQAEMTGLDIDTRSDIYSLGVLLYELLTGKTPFDAKELLATGLEAMRRTIREKEPVRPSTRLSTMLAGELTATAKRRGVEAPKLLHLLRGDLDWIVMRAVEKDRARRYETANGLARDIERHLTNEPVVARPPSAAYRLQKAWRRNKVAFTAAAVVVAALVVGIGISSWQAIVASRARNAEMRQRVAAQAAQQGEMQERQRAERRETEARQNLYAAHMNLALQAVEEQNIGYALKLLDLQRPQPGRADLRGWEWRYLWKVCRSDELLRLGSHSNTVLHAVFSPKGDVLATCSGDQTVRLWDVTARREPAVLPHEGCVLAAAFSADGNRLATFCKNAYLHLWDVATGRDLRRVAVGNVAVTRWAIPVAFSPGGEMLALGEGTNVCLWDVVRGSRVSIFDAGRTPGCLALSPNGKILATGAAIYQDNSVGLWDLSRPERPELILLLTNQTHAGSLAFSFDGKTLAGAVGDTIKLWDLATGGIIQTLTGHSAGIPAIAFSSDGKLLASASADDTARLWDVATGQGTTLRGHLNEVWAVAIAPDGRTVATGTKKDGIVSLWSTTPKSPEQTSHTLPKTLRLGGDASRFSPDGTKFLAVYADKTLGLWDTAGLKEATSFPLDIADQTALALSPLGKWAALGEPDGAVRLVETSAGREIANFGPRGAGVDALAFSMDGSKLAAATADHKFRVWEIARKRVLSEMASRGTLVGFPAAFVFSTDGVALCAGYEDSTAEIFDTARGRRLALLEGAKAPICGVVLLPDGSTAATADFAQDVKLWDLKTRKELVTLGGEIRAHFALALSPDGRRLAAGGASPVVRLWDPATRQQVALLKITPPSGFSRLTFSADGNMLVLLGGQTLHAWRAASWAEIEAAEKKTEFKTH